MRRRTGALIMLWVALGVPFVMVTPVFAATAGVSQIETFLESVIKIIAGLASLVATGFFVVGGYQYITSSGNPIHLDKAKRTLLNSAIGLTIVIASFVIANIVTGLATSAFGS